MSIKFDKKPIKADVLIVGGGVAGMQAAITAREKGADVLVCEKADTRRSGNGSTGNDHYMCYLPEIHGDDFDFVVKQVLDTMEGPLQDHILLKQLLRRSHEIVEKWESYGIPMRPYGKYIFEGHSLPTRQKYHLKYDGSNQKPILTRVAKEKGARIYNHITISNLLTGKDGKVIGAVGVDTSDDEPKLVVFEAKAVIIATGNLTRAYPNSTPSYIFNLNGCPACAGGAILGYRAGAKLINTDFLYRHAGPKYFERSGKATWLGVIADSNGKPVGPYVTKATREFGDPFSDVYPSVFSDRLKNGSGPTYVDCRTLSDEDMAYMQHCFVTEGVTSINDYIEQRGIDLHKDMIEFGTYSLSVGKGGLEINLKAEASIKGLYAAGTACGNVRGNITCASVYGMIAGENAAEYTSSIEFESVEDNPLIDREIKLFSEIIERKEGANWKEVNSTIQNIMNEYVGGEIRTETLITAGLKYLRDLRRLALKELKAENSHELMRTIEVLDILDFSEVAALTARNRKESRGNMHKRPDYPYTNVLLNDHYQTIEKKNGKVYMEFRENIRG